MMKDEMEPMVGKSDGVRQRSEKVKLSESMGRYARLSDLPQSEWPQERILREGVEACSSQELLAILIRSGGGDVDVLQIAHGLMDRAGGLIGLIGWKPEDFQAIPGIGVVKSLQLTAAFQLARRAITESRSDADFLMNAPEKVYALLEPVAVGLDTERFWVVGLNRKNRLIRYEEVSAGTATSSLAHPREIFREAIRQGAAGLIVAHNHPSGDPAPSRADIEVTRRLREAARVIGIDLIDHIVLGHRKLDPRGIGFYSFNDAGLL